MRWAAGAVERRRVPPRSSGRAAREDLLGDDLPTAARAPRRPCRGPSAGRRCMTSSASSQSESGRAEMWMPARAWNSSGEPRAQRGRRDPGAGQLAGEALGEHGDEGLLGGVAAVGDERGDRRDVEDGAAAPRAHGPPGRVAGEHGRPHHDVEAGLDGDVVVEEGAVQPEAGVVDEQVDRPHVVLEPGRDREGGHPVGEARAGQHLDGDPVAGVNPAASSWSRTSSRATSTRSAPLAPGRGASAKARLMPAEAP